MIDDLTALIERLRERADYETEELPVDKRDTIFADALNALARLSAPGWRSIESAPESGRFLVAGGEWNSEITDERSNTIALIQRGYGASFPVADTGVYEARIDEPTHWHPLPTPPATGGEG